jgi:hypothetical protein
MNRRGHQRESRTKKPALSGVFLVFHKNCGKLVEKTVHNTIAQAPLHASNRLPIFYSPKNYVKKQAVDIYHWKITVL